MAATKLGDWTDPHLNDIRAERPLSADARKRVEQIKRAMQLEIALAELRGTTQTQIAETLGTPRPNIGRRWLEALDPPARD